jgi:5'-deoxynucleotidase YfbR-like HD superfamily hydrolase
MSDTDVARHSTRGLPRAISVGGKVIEFSSDPSKPIIDVSKLPKIDAVCIQLATINRFNGATIHAYNVAQHSCMVGSLVASRNPELELPALLHDLPEIIYGDIVTGVKYSIGMILTRFTDQIDALVMNHYLSRFGFRYPLPAAQHSLIKEADTFALLLEAQSLLPPGSKPSDNPQFWPEQPQSIRESSQDFTKLADTLVPMSRETACANLLNRIKSAVAKLKKVT